MPSSTHPGGPRAVARENQARLPTRTSAFLDQSEAFTRSHTETFAELNAVAPRTTARLCPLAHLSFMLPFPPFWNLEERCSEQPRRKKISLWSGHVPWPMIVRDVVRRERRASESVARLALASSVLDASDAGPDGCWLCSGCYVRRVSMCM